MRIKRWAGLALAGGMLTASVVALPAVTAQAAAQTLNIQVGGDRMVGGVLVEGMRFMAPPNLQVHKGDTLTFTFAGFHTATLIPTGVGAEDWRADNQAGLAGKYSLVVPDGDDGPTTFMFNPAVGAPSDPSCGAATNPCPYDGKSVVNSGLPSPGATTSTFSVTVNANPNDTFWVLCLVHGMMQTRIQVVADNAPATTQAEVDSYKTSQTAADNEAAAALLPKLNQPTHRTVNGARVWDAYAGFDGDGWGLDGMFPKHLSIKKGDTVRWHFAQLTGNIHTVTFPLARATNLNGDFNAANAKCEADPTDTPPDAQPPQFCSSGPQNLEIEIRGNALLPVGTHKIGRHNDFRSSGVEGAETPSTAPYDLTFTRRSGKKPFTYACNVHGPMMSGTVRVS